MGVGAQLLVVTGETGRRFGGGCVVLSASVLLTSPGQDLVTAAGWVLMRRLSGRDHWGETKLLNLL